MSNNDTLNGALTTLGELMATNLNTMNVPDAQASDGLTTLANKILNIPRFVNVVSFTVAGDVDMPDFNPLYDGDNLVVLYGDDSYDSYTTGELNHSYSDGESLHTVYVIGGLTGLGDECFMGCTGLETITIPASIISIGTDCFKDCNINNYELYWAQSNIYPYDADKMPVNTSTIFTIPQGETENYITAGYPAGKLREREAPMVILEYTGDNITIGDNSSWLPSVGDVLVDWGDGNTDIVNNPITALEHTYTDGVNNHIIKLIGEITSLGSCCFMKCAGLTEVTIPDTVTSLGDYCFINCSDLTKVIIPESVISIGMDCFMDCESLTSIALPNSVTSLGDYCFTGCTHLTKVTIPESVINLGNFCFAECTSLIDYQLYWTNDNIIKYNRRIMPINTNTIFTIPQGETTNYTNKGYPADKIQERS